MTKKSNGRIKNALVHGIYSSDIVLPWEKCEDFDKLLKGLREDFSPQGTTENRIVFDLALLYWKKARVNRLTQFLVRQSPPGAQIAASGKRTTKSLCAHFDVRRIDETPDFDVPMKQVESLKSLIIEEGNNLPEEVKNRHLEKVLSAQKVIADLRSAMAGPAETVMAGDLSSLLGELAKSTELEARLDGMIDRTIQRLVAAKELKRVYAPAVLIASKPAEDNDNDNDNDDSGIRPRGSERRKREGGLR